MAAIMDMGLTDRTVRDITIDHMNPDEVLPRYIRSEDEIPDFKPQLVRMYAPQDGEATDQVQMVQSARANFIKEDTKYSNPEPASKHYFKGSSEYALGKEPRGTQSVPTDYFSRRAEIAPVDF